VFDLVAVAIALSIVPDPDSPRSTTPGAAAEAGHG
jgi:hypothetical protein